MEITIDEAIQYIKNSCYIVGYPTHDKQQETREKVNASLDMAINIMHKYQRIEQLLAIDDENHMRKIRLSDLKEMLEDGNVD